MAKYTCPKRYGIGYMGSKNKIAEKVVSALPKADVLIDLFAGGCAITHCAMESGKFAQFYANDISDSVELFHDAVQGRYHNDERWISREDFAKLKAKEPYIRLCWSFGNTGREYLYSKEVEPWKMAYHYACVGDCSLMAEIGITLDAERQAEYEKTMTILGRRLVWRGYIRTHHKECKETYVAWYKKTFFKDTANEIEIVANNIEVEKEKLRNYLLEHLQRSGLKQTDVNRILGTQMAGHYYGKSQWEFPTFEEYEKLRPFMNWTHDYPITYKLAKELQRLQSLESLQSLQSLESLQRLQSLQSLQSLQRLQSLQSLQSLERLNISQLDYKEAYEMITARIESGESVVVYCDPPYKGTAQYNGVKTAKDKGAFDNDEFHDWARAQIRKPHAPLFLFSEYNMPQDFSVVKEMLHVSCLNGLGTSAHVSEKVFCHVSQLSKYNSMIGKKREFVQLEIPF